MNVQPISQRIVFLDVLRAFALLGIYVAIIHGFNGSIIYGTEAVAGPLDQFFGRIESLFINKRFIGLLSLLFGVGIAIQQQNFQHREAPFLGYFLKRMVILGCFGLINTTFYFNGEILLVYAVFGALALAVSRLPSKTVFVIAAFCYLVPGQIFEVAVRDNLIEWFQWFPDEYSAERVKEIYTGTDYLQMIRLRWIEYAYIYTDNNFHLAMSFSMILWGYLIGKHGYHESFLSQLSRYTIPFALSAVFTVLFGALGLITGMTDYIFAYNPIGYFFYAAFMLTSMFTYVYVVAIAVYWLGQQSIFVKAMSNNGRLCLTGYMGGALAYSFVFYGYGAGMYMKCSNVALLAISLAMYAAFTVFSALWLRRFNRGPLEWLFRRLSYGRLV